MFECGDSRGEQGGVNQEEEPDDGDLYLGVRDHPGAAHLGGVVRQVWI